MSGKPLARVLVVDDEAHITDSVKRALERSGYHVTAAADAATALDKIERTAPELVLCDIRLHETDGMQLLGQIKEQHPEIAVVMMTGYASIESAVSAIQAGASDYLAKPFDPTQLRHAVAKALEQKRLVEENRYLKSELQQITGDEFLVGQSRVMLELFDAARRVAATDSSVLIVGKSGTGKEVLARFVHNASARKERPFVTVNCAAIPATLIESELFGHRRGAFTGASYNRRGSFELADRGTLFLDEIGEMPVEMQAKILRVLEDRQIKRVGSEESIAVDVRIIAATNRDLAEATKDGRFRGDLFYRLNVVQLEVPPLAERQEDILPLARHFLRFYSQEQKKPIPDFSREALQAFEGYEWPGNVRELRNAVERAVIFGEAGQPIRLAHLPPYLQQAGPKGRPEGVKGLRALRDIELDYIREVLEACGGNRTKAAEVLGISVVTLWRKLGKDDRGETPEGPIGV